MLGEKRIAEERDAFAASMRPRRERLGCLRFSPTQMTNMRALQ